MDEEASSSTDSTTSSSKRTLSNQSLNSKSSNTSRNASNKNATSVPDRGQPPRKVLPAPPPRHPLDKQLCGSDEEPEKQEAQNNRKGSGRKGKGRKREKEAQRVSRIVQKKLETYVNYEQRENRFDPHGQYRTTQRMHQYDLAYKLSEEKAHKDKKHSQNQGDATITPRLVRNSRRMVTECETARLAEYANQVFQQVPVDQLSVIHRYRPHSQKTPRSTETGHVQNYTAHVGAALHSQHYVHFYKQEGLDTGDPKTSQRLKRLPKKSTCQQTDREPHCESRRSANQPSQRATHAHRNKKILRVGDKDGCKVEERKEEQEGYSKGPEEHNEEQEGQYEGHEKHNGEHETHIEEHGMGNEENEVNNEGHEAHNEEHEAHNEEHGTLSEEDGDPKQTANDMSEEYNGQEPRITTPEIQNVDKTSCSSSESVSSSDDEEDKDPSRRSSLPEAGSPRGTHPPEEDNMQDAKSEHSLGSGDSLRVASKQSVKEGDALSAKDCNKEDNDRASVQTYVSVGHAVSVE